MPLPMSAHTHDGQTALEHNNSSSIYRTARGIGVNSYWAKGLKSPPPTFMIMGLT